MVEMKAPSVRMRYTCEPRVSVTEALAIVPLQASYVRAVREGRLGTDPASKLGTRDRDESPSC
jgi:hypothetical protein